jgi:Mrp family chromosome partitioning ATPase
MMDTTTRAEAQTDGEKQGSSASLVRLAKPIVVSPDAPKPVDTGYVSSRFYSCFNASILGPTRSPTHLAIGVTSPRRGDGKTLVAANLAVALAAASQLETVLVDLNVKNPMVHSIFGGRQAPGLMEALTGPTIQLMKTRVKGLHILPAGTITASLAAAEEFVGEQHGGGRVNSRQGLTLDAMTGFRDVMYSLKEEFDVVIVDMPSVTADSFSTLLTHQVDGLLLVVAQDRSKHTDLEAMMRVVNPSHIIGFVLNHADIPASAN